MKRILSLDASSTTIGLSVIDYDNRSMNLIHKEFYKPPKKGDLFERLFITKTYIKNKIQEFSPDEVAMEDIVLFMNKFSTAKTITTLAILNRTVGLAIYEEMKKPPFLYNAMKIRHKIKKDGYLPSKEDIPDLVSEILNIKFNWIYRKYKGNQIKSEENFDIADAIACGICHIYISREEGSKNTKKKKKKKSKKNEKR